MSYWITAKSEAVAAGVSMSETAEAFEPFGPPDFYRVHTGRNATDSLNAPGMEFHPLPFADGASRPDPQLDPDAGPNRFHAYGVVARLALVAAAREIAQSGVEDE